VFFVFFFLCTKGRLVRDPEILGGLNKGTPFQVISGVLDITSLVKGYTR